jgi:membrane associated rhomboid family serine protease
MRHRSDVVNLARMKHPTRQDTDPDTDVAWIAVRTFASLEMANEHALVALAMGESCRVVHAQEQSGFLLETEFSPSPRLRQEWLAYDQENHAEPTSEIDDSPADSSQRWWSLALWMSAVMAAFLWQHRHPELASWLVSSSTGLVEKHQWWRPFTALFLHADLGHLMGNLLTAVFFTPFVGRHFGAWRGWAWILLSGALGNALNAYLSYPQSFSSLGASTAIFSALGLLTASGIADLWRLSPRPSLTRLSTPLLAGIALLGLLGNSPDPLTDVSGHVCGFLMGLAVGLVVRAWQPHTVSATAGE